MDLFTFDPAVIASFLLTLMRVSLILFLMPFFGGQTIPAPVKAALCVVLSLALWPKLSFPGSLFPGNIWSISLMLLGEVALGLVLSLVVHFLFAAVQMGGSIMGFQMGFSMINIVDPVTGTSETVTAHFLYMVTLLTFLVMNGHLYLLKGLAQTFDMIPPGGLFLSPGLANRVLEYSGGMFVLAIKICAPVMTAVLLIDLALALISRAAPQMNVLVLGFPVKIGVGFLFLGLTFSYLARFVGQYVNDMGLMFQSLLSLAIPPAN